MTRSARWGMTALALALTTAACGSDDTSGAGLDTTPIRRVPTSDNEFTPRELEQTIDDLVAALNERPSQSMQMAILLKDLSGFWMPVIKAANRAIGELGVLGSVVGPIAERIDDMERVELQNRQIAQVVADGAEGIGLAPFNKVQDAAVDDAIAKGVHVVTLDTDVPDTKRALHVGTFDLAAGRTAAQTMLSMLPPPPGTVIVHGNEDTAWVNGMERTQGAQAVLEGAGYEVLVRQATWTDTGGAEDVAAMAALIEDADPPVVGMLGLFNISFRCAMAAEAAGKTDIPIVAFDFDPMTVDYMRRGRIQVTHIQRQYYQGYLVPYILYGIKSIGLKAVKEILAPQMVDDSRLNTGVDVVPADKIDAYNDFLGSIGANQ